MKQKFWSWAGNRLNFKTCISDESWFEEKTARQKFSEELNNHNGDIMVLIDSFGGDYFAAEAIYEMLREYRGCVTVKIEKIAASAASVIAMAGAVVEIAHTGKIFVHNPKFYGYGGDDDEKREAGYMLEEITESIINIYQRRTKLSRAQLSRMMAAETWLNADEAVTLGFADTVYFNLRRKHHGQTDNHNRRRNRCDETNRRAGVPPCQRISRERF